jgi:hypothetical protein
MYKPGSPSKPRKSAGPYGGTDAVTERLILWEKATLNS